jgi:spermidine synthase
MYGLLELAISISVAVSPWLIAWMGSLYLSLGGQDSMGVAGASLVRLVLASTIMAIPTFLMGGTLPAVVRAVTRPDDRHRRALGVLYGANTLGAVCGTAAATFFALENLGTRLTLWSGCAISFTAGAVAIFWSRRLAANTEQGSTEGVARSGDEYSLPDNPADSLSPLAGSYLIYFTAAALGFTFFALELVWYRMLAPILGGTAFTFGLILCIALSGIGIGGVAYEYVFRWLRPTWSALAITCGCEAALAILPFAVGDHLAVLAARQRHAANSFGELILGWAVVAGIVVLPVSLVSGLQFPLLVALLGEGRQRVSKHLGMTYAWNTLGAIAGSLVTGFGALPLLSAPGLWQAVAVVLAALSLAILMLAPRVDRRAGLIVSALAVLTFGSLYAQGPTAVWRHSGIGAGPLVAASLGPNQLRQWMNENRQTLEWEMDGIESSIAINRMNGLSFIVNGKADGNALTDAATQIGIAVLGAVLHPEPKTALVIGLGTGETAGWLAEMDGIERVDVVELEPALDEMARRCREVNHDVLNNPRVRRIYNDGREFVLATKNKYDLVISEPSNPYRAGVATLYTTEFYRAVVARLNERGLFMQWLQAYDVDDRTVSTVLATARSVFPHVEVWQTLPNDLQLVCSRTRLAYSTEQVRERIASPVIQQALAVSWNAYDLEGFLSHFLAGPAWADEIATGDNVPLNTDDRTLLEYRFAKAVGRAQPTSIEAARVHLAPRGGHRPRLDDASIDWNRVELYRQEFNLLNDVQPSASLLPGPQNLALIEAFSRYRAATRSGDFAGVVDRWPADYNPPSTPIQRLVLARSYAELGRPACLELIAASEEQFPIEAAALNAVLYSKLGNAGEAARYLERYYELLKTNPWMIPLVAETAFNRTIDVARADRNAAEKLYPHLTQPFASYRLDYLRRLVRFFVGQQLGQDKTLEALTELEPNASWLAAVLEPRAQLYSAINHPIAPRAQSEWLLFQRQQPRQ